MSRILKYPIWFLELFTEAKSFESNPIIGSYWLNRFGLHVVRVLAAHSLTSIRRFILGLGLPAHLKQEFRRNGCLIIEDALDEKLFHQLVKEAQEPWPEVRYFVQGDTTTEFVFLDSIKLQQLPACQKLSDDKKLNRLMTYVAACGLKPWMDFLRVVNISGVQKDDPQKYFHSDTFHPTMKAWLFLEDINQDKGPFEYVLGSHKPTLKRLKWEYRQSLGIREAGQTYARRGSLRVSETELNSLGLGDVKSMKVKANTLVIADTFGFHRRGQGAANSTRLSMAFSNRINPFLPLPIPGIKAFEAFVEKLVNKHYEATTEVRRTS